MYDGGIFGEIFKAVKSCADLFAQFKKNAAHCRLCGRKFKYIKTPFEGDDYDKSLCTSCNRAKREDVTTIAQKRYQDELSGKKTTMWDVVGDLVDYWMGLEYSIVVDDNAGVWEKLAAFLRAAGIMGLNNYTYRGYFYDTETGLYYLQSRYYDPEVGRFINLDETNIAVSTTGEVFGASLFTYCCNNPINFVDYNGKIANTVIIAGTIVPVGFVFFGVFWC